MVWIWSPEWQAINDNCCIHTSLGHSTVLREGKADDDRYWVLAAKNVIIGLCLSYLLFAVDTTRVV